MRVQGLAQLTTWNVNTKSLLNTTVNTSQHFCLLIETCKYEEPPVFQRQPREPVNFCGPSVKTIKRNNSSTPKVPPFPQVNNTHSAALDIRPVCPFPVVYKVHDGIFPSSPWFVTSVSPHLIAAAPVIRLLKHPKPIFETEKERKRDIIAASHWGKASSSAG